jgi:hypothetical protein
MMIEEYEAWIGQDVQKIGRTPFNSGYTTATVQSITISPYTGNPGFKFNSCDNVVDDIVDCTRCELV